MLDIHIVTEQEYKAVFAKTEFNSDGEIDIYELAIFVLRVTGLERLISDEKITNLMGYEQVYAR